MTYAVDLSNLALEANGTAAGITANATAISAISVGNATVNTTINATSFSGTANNANNIGGTSLATLQTQITGNAATAYTNATTYSANASNLGNGTVGTAVLGSGAANSSTILYGNSAWAAAPSSGYSNFVVFTSSNTWTCPAGITKALVTVVGGGAGASTGSPALAPGNGGTTSFVGPITVSAAGGGIASGGAGGPGGIGSNGDLNMQGGAGIQYSGGGHGGSSYYQPGAAAQLNSGPGINGGGGSMTQAGGGGGAAIKNYSNLVPTTVYTVTVGLGGTAGTSGYAGGNGVVTIFY
jgi:hypothetical protein